MKSRRKKPPKKTAPPGYKEANSVELNKLIKEVVEAEKSAASGEHKVNEGISREQQTMDSLARLLTYNEICVAVRLLKGQLLVGSNKKNGLIEAKKYLSLLKEFIKYPFDSSYDILCAEKNKQLKILIKNLCIIGSSGEEARIESYLRQPNDIELVNIAQLVKKLYPNSSLHEIGALENTLKRSIAKEDSLARNLAVELIYPTIDLNNIAKSLITGENAFFKMIKAIVNSDSSSINLLPGIEHKHAEMEVLEEVVKTSKPLDLMKNRIEHDPEDYTGITKLTCFLCNIVMSWFNQSYSGTHGKTYPNWLPIKILLDNPHFSNFKGMVKSDGWGRYPQKKELYPFTSKLIPKRPELTKCSGHKDLGTKLTTLEESRKKLAISRRELENLIEQQKASNEELQELEIKIQEAARKHIESTRNESEYAPYVKMKKNLKKTSDDWPSIKTLLKTFYPQIYKDMLPGIRKNGEEDEKIKYVKKYCKDKVKEYKKYKEKYRSHDSREQLELGKAECTVQIEQLKKSINEQKRDLRDLNQSIREVKKIIPDLVLHKKLLNELGIFSEDKIEHFKLLNMEISGDGYSIDD